MRPDGEAVAPATAVLQQALAEEMTGHRD